MEIDAYKLTIKLNGTKTRDTSIAFAAKGSQNYKFEGIRNQRLSTLKIIGRAEKNVAVPYMDELRGFFQTLCQEKINTVDEIIFVDQFPENVVQMLSNQLFKKLSVKHLRLLRTKMSLFDFAALKTLTHFTIDAWSEGERCMDDCAYEIDVARLRTLLQNNRNLKFLQVPDKSYSAFKAIIEQRKQTNELDLKVVDKNGRAKNVIRITGTTLATELDSKELNNILLELPSNRFDQVRVKMSLGSSEALGIQAPFWVNQKTAKTVNITTAEIKSDADRINLELSGSSDPLIFVAQRSNHFIGAEWTYMHLDTFVYNRHDIYRAGEIVAAFQKQFRNLRQLDIRYIFQNKTWQPDEHVNEELRAFGKYTCNGLPYDQDVNLRLRMITIKCKF